MTDEDWMRHALALAEKAYAAGEVPCGAVLVRDGQVIGEGWNQSISQHDASAHAEVMALRAAGAHEQNYRIPGSTLYVTLEPCPMCAGAMLHGRVERLVFGAYDSKTGAAGSVFDLVQDKRHYHTIAVTGGVLEAECVALIQAFFRERRAAKKVEKQREK